MAKARKSVRKAAKRSSTPKRKPAAKRVAPVPAEYGSVTPYLVCRDTKRAIEFYRKAFGAKVKLKMDSPSGGVMHAEISIGDSIVMLGDEMPAMGATAPETVGGTASGIMIYTENADRMYARAIAAGARSEMAPQKMFWGDRYCKLVDPFGHQWAIATHVEDVPPREMARRGREAMAQMPSEMPS
jgi:PhnB protein